MMPADHLHKFWGQLIIPSAARHLVWMTSVSEHPSWLGLHCCEDRPLTALQGPSPAGSLPCRVCAGDTSRAGSGGGRPPELCLLCGNLANEGIACNTLLQLEHVISGGLCKKQEVQNAAA